MNRLLLGKTGWGKSWYGQAIMEANVDRYDLFAAFDYKDEYRGLVVDGHAERLIVGPQEAALPRSAWKRIFDENPRLVLCRYQLSEDEWRETVARIVSALRQVCRSGPDVFLALDEAHFTAPVGSAPDPIKGVATTGRGEGVSALWMSQRAAELNETVISECQEQILGGFTGERDLSKLGSETPYPVELHNPQSSPADVGRVPEEIAVDGEAVPLRKFKKDGGTLGSEWIYANDRGDLERRDTRNVTMTTTHYGPEGRSIADP